MFGDISQKFDISAKRKKKSAKNSIYQPNARRNQPKIQYISQTQEEISQKFDISAKPNNHKKKAEKKLKTKAYSLQELRRKGFLLQLRY